MKTTIPCIKDKCLKYPVCKSKRTISCDKLFKYVYTIEHDNYISWQKDRLADKFPNVKCIQCE